MKKRERVLEIMRAVREVTGLVLFAKLSPELGDMVEIAGEVIQNGADGITAMNTLKGMAIDIRHRRPRLANVTGGLSGPAIKPVALRYVYEIKKTHRIPVMAAGGITTAEDAVEFLIAGADLLAVGTANFVNPAATMDILKGITEYCKRERIKQLDELRASLRIEDTGYRIQ
jgi:dihydroorotate dehydrogenase (NAD+) catalytic subunit